MYLQVKFHDNDFSFPLEEALEELWCYIREHNASYYQTGGEDPSKLPETLFKQLHAAGQLVPMINRMWVLRVLSREVETMTRHLGDGINIYSKKEWLDDLQPIKDTYTEYFGKFDIEFHKSRSNEFENGEDGWLDLETGKTFLL